MDRPRSELHEILKEILGTNNVYFQPPSSTQMQYPCIIYAREYADNRFADNAPYRRTKRYMVTVVDRDPDSAVPDKLSELPLCTFNRFYVADDLNHDVFKLYF